MRKEITAMKDAEALSQSIHALQTTDLQECKNKISRLEDENTKLRKALDTRNEMNENLVHQVESLQSNHIAVTKAELERFEQLDEENSNQQTRIASLVRSVDVYLSALQKTEAEGERMTSLLEERSKKNELLQREIEVHMKSVARGEVLTKRMRNDIIKLQKDVDRLQHENDVLRKDPAGKDEVVRSMKDDLACLTKTKQEETEEKMSEIKRRKAAEEAVKALRNRVSFLLEQMEQTSTIAFGWQDQKVRPLMLTHH